METKERPILMSGPMVRPCLAGTKTQTRRIINTQPSEKHFTPERNSYLASARVEIQAGKASAVFEYTMGEVEAIPCPYGKPGDRLWVRENFYCDYGTFADRGPLPKERPEWADDNLYYAADGSCCDQIPECQCADVGKPRWRPSIHMPRWACRLVLEIVSVRLELLQDISEKDALAEGVTKIRDGCHVIKGFDYDKAGLCHTHAVTPFEKLWESINGPGSWALNPWVWVVEFKRVQLA